MSAPVIELRGLCFRRDPSRLLLEGVELELRAGERLGLCGANGSGKSSLLHLLLGLEPADAGHIQLFGQVCSRETDFRSYRGRIGLMFQDPEDQLFCPTVEEDVAFGPLNQGYKHPQVCAMVERTLRELRLSHLATRPVHQLSGGEKRMVALAGLLVMQPEVLLLDEPTCGLDEDAQARVVETLVSLPQAMIVVSHDPDFLGRIATRRLLLRQGVLAAAQPVPQMARSLSFEANPGISSTP